MLIESRQVLDSRKKDIDNTTSLISKMKVENACIEKASIVLMIYNMIEGVITVILGEFFSFLIDNNICIDEQSVELKNTILQYYLIDMQKKSNKESLILLSNFRSAKKIQIPQYVEFSKKINLYSGNLDAAEIRSLSKKFNVVYSGSQTDKNLLYIKNIRNKLAHGELKYSEACRDKTEEEIKSYSEIAYSYLLRVIKAFENKYNI
ncbi:MAE_28990/MAE_18760 family HEPN-like nuclease [uncultured Treponema sp.]|uniref:MAE_28990/MAE_18760 family HEPN-like nuclease n=1 Tax=uncultured Treponema sp. TaxID=162155 RepID=UPI0025E02F24|nr:MAE_28990/MAE_18760 family HEPN-like nuclease [uncultured Treponema sp.]